MKFRRTWTWNVPDIKRILRLIENSKPPLLHICSGSSGIGDIRLDRYKIRMPLDNSFADDYRGSPNVLGDMDRLPFKDGCVGTIICDPPYTDSVLNNKNMVSEMVRVLKPGGNLVFYAPWIITHKHLELKKTTPLKVGKNNHYYKLLSVLYKSNGMLGDYG